MKSTSAYRFVLQPNVRFSGTSDQTMDLDVFVDSDWAGCPKTRKSTSGFLILFLGCPITFGSRTQQTPALSSAEAELYAIGTGCSEGLAIRSLLLESNFVKRLNVRVATDSSSGKSMAVGLGASRKSRHIEVRYLFIQHLVQAGMLIVRKVLGTDNPADVFTKYVSKETLNKLSLIHI